jgi:hypothetical protein
MNRDIKIGRCGKGLKILGLVGFAAGSENPPAVVGVGPGEFKADAPSGAGD